MITLRYLSGPYKGRSRNVTKLDPQKFLHKLVDSQWEWDIDYSQGTDREIRDWFSADLGCRIGKAAIAMCPIYFMGNIYVASKLSEVFDVINRVTTHITWRSCETFFISDSGCGLFISSLSLN